MSTNRTNIGEKIFKVVLSDGSVMALNGSHITTDEHGNLRLWQSWKLPGGDPRYDIFNEFVAVWASGQWRSCVPIGTPTP